MTRVFRVASILLFSCCGFVNISNGQRTAPVAPTDKHVMIHCNKVSGDFDLSWPDGTRIGPIGGSIELTNGQHWAVSDFPKHTITSRADAPDGYKAASMREWEIRSFGRDDAPQLVEHVYYEPGKPFVLVELEAVGKGPLSSRHISPVKLSPGGSASFAAKVKPAVLFVPNDNDMWVHYNEPIDPAKDPDSYEVSAIFDNASRKGMVLGSVTHELWRTGVLAREASDGMVRNVEVYGGATGHWTHDVEPHGVVTGTTLRSPLVMIGYYQDWRNGMEEYAQINAKIHPPLAWAGGVPFGWNSWSAYLMKIDAKKYLAVADFIHDQLEPRGFENDGTTYVNLDGGWTQMKEEEVISAAKHVHAQGQKAGIYFTPFSYWSDDFTRPVEGTNGKYHYSDILLRDSKGNPLPKVDGARPLDPTHPGTIARIDYELARYVAWGYDSVKLDFLNCGSMEGVHHDPSITTGVAAYSYGMRRIEEDLSPEKIGRPFFISLSIAPLFPAYGHSRRVSCDAFGRIQDSEYLLNAVTFGWWTNGTLYRFNDPDHTVISRDVDPYHDQAAKGSVQTYEEARSRVNATVIAGTLLLDSDDLMDPRAQGRAKSLLTNSEILDVARAGRSFRPVEGDAGTHAANVFERNDPDGSVFVAVFNFSPSERTKMTLAPARLGLDADREYRVHDLWLGKDSEFHGAFDVALGPAESKILHLIPK